MEYLKQNWPQQQRYFANQFADFQRVFDRTHFHWDLKNQTHDEFQAGVRRRVYDDFILTQVITDPLRGTRSGDDIKKNDDHYFCLLYFEEGRSLLAQGPNETVVEEGSIALWDSTRPAFFNATQRLHQCSLLIPHSVATTCLPGIEDLCGLQVSSESGMGALLLSHLKKLHESIDDIDPKDRPAILRATVELATAAFRPTQERLNGTAFKRALLSRVQEYIIANLSDPDLGPQKIAETFNFSPRYLHRLFSEFDITVSDWIKKRRLQRSFNELQDSRFAAQSITQIALKNGFNDSSGFSRAFKAEFGISPRSARS
ncbi:MAG: helix-turn-helix domain-containing protein [Pseudomonadota bacterium]